MTRRQEAVAADLAGGCISDWNGDPLRFESDDRVLASDNQRLHELALDICTI